MNSTGLVEHVAILTVGAVALRSGVTAALISSAMSVEFCVSRSGVGPFAKGVLTLDARALTHSHISGTKSPTIPRAAACANAPCIALPAPLMDVKLPSTAGSAA